MLYEQFFSQISSRVTLHANFTSPSAMHFAVVLRLHYNELRPVQILINTAAKTIIILYERTYRATSLAFEAMTLLRMGQVVNQREVSTEKILHIQGDNILVEPQTIGLFSMTRCSHYTALK